MFETRNRDDELNMMGQVDIEIDSKMTDVSNRNCRTIIKNEYFSIYVPISEKEARSIAAAESIGVLMRGGPDAGVFLGISGMKVDSGRDLLTGFINAHTT
jgi:hypothetical protein